MQGEHCYQGCCDNGCGKHCSSSCVLLLIVHCHNVTGPSVRFGTRSLDDGPNSSINYAARCSKTPGDGHFNLGRK